jgi:drug/metabolite transporter (DMT)-like permease
MIAPRRPDGLTGGALNTAIAAAAAVAGSVVFGVSAVAEQRGTQRVERRPPLSPRLVLDLIRQPLWLLGIGANLFGFALQVVALTFGPLALVEPILISDLIVASVLASFLRRRWDPVLLLGVTAAALGVGAFLAIARPSAGRTTVGWTVVVPLAIGLAVVLVGCLAVARRSDNARPLALALACGVDYGVAAFVVKLMTSDFSGGLGEVFTHWPVYALAIVGPLGFLLNQNAFQQGILLAPVLAVITVSDPLVSIALGNLWLHENLTSTPAAVAGEVLALVVMTLGIIMLAYRAPMVTRQLTGDQKPASGAASAGTRGRDDPRS